MTVIGEGGKNRSARKMEALCTYYAFNPGALSSPKTNELLDVKDALMPLFLGAALWVAHTLS